MLQIVKIQYENAPNPCLINSFGDQSSYSELLLGTSTSIETSSMKLKQRSRNSSTNYKLKILPLNLWSNQSFFSYFRIISQLSIEK